MATKKTATVKKITDPEIKELKKDYDELKKIIGKLQGDLKSVGSTKISQVQETGQEKIDYVLDQAKANPRKALAYAFGAGLVSALLLRR